MKNILIATAVVLAAAGSSAETLREKFDKTYAFRPNSLFALTNTNGSVTIKTWNNPQVRIEAEKVTESSDPAVARRAMQEVRIDIRERNGGLEVATHVPRHRDGFFDWLAGESVNAHVRYTVTVPRMVNLDVQTVNGAVVIADVNGAMEVETTNGSIDVVRGAGTLDAETTNGKIKAQLLTLTAGRGLTLETTNGSITVEVPANTKAQLDAATTNGKIHTDLPVTTTQISKTRLNGAINGGGAPIRLRTTNGSIRLQKN